MNHIRGRGLQKCTMHHMGEGNQKSDKKASDNLLTTLYPVMDLYKLINYCINIDFYIIKKAIGIAVNQNCCGA